MQSIAIDTKQAHYSIYSLALFATVYGDKAILAPNVSEGCTGIIFHPVSTSAMCPSTTSLHFPSLSPVIILTTRDLHSAGRFGATPAHFSLMRIRGCGGLYSLGGLSPENVSGSDSEFGWCLCGDTCLCTYSLPVMEYFTSHCPPSKYILIALQLSSDLSVRPCRHCKELFSLEPRYPIII